MKDNFIKIAYFVSKNDFVFAIISNNNMNY